MKLMTGFGISLALVGIVAGATLTITTLLGVTFEGSEPKLAQGVRESDLEINEPKSQETARYPGYSFCVEAIGVDQALEAIGKAKIEAALLDVMQHPYWSLLRPGSPSPIVDIGCPSDPLIARPGVDWDGPNFHARGDLHQYDVVEPSFYWTFAFIMPGEQIKQLLGDAHVRMAPQEYRTEGDVGHLETTAIFIAPEELDDAPFLVKHLLIAVGLESVYPESEFPESSQR